MTGLPLSPDVHDALPAMIAGVAGRSRWPLRRADREARQPV